MADRQTMKVYAERASDYAKRFGTGSPDTHLNAFMAALPKGGRVLDLGCGPARSTANMIEAGFEAEGWDVSPEMGAAAKSLHGVDVRLAEFGDLSAENAYDGIYANFSLLHAPKTETPAHLGRIARALKPGGCLHLGLKTGKGERRDKLGRFYAFYEDDEISRLLDTAGFEVTSRTTGSEAGLDGTIAPWIILLARKT